MAQELWGSCTDRYRRLLWRQVQLQFTIAAAILDGELTYDTFTDEKVNAPAIQAMMKRVVLAEDPLCAKLPARIAAADRSQKLTIHLKDGREVSDSIEATTNTLRGHQVDIKFEANASQVLPSDQAKKALELLHNLKNLSDVTEMMDSVTLN